MMRSTTLLSTITFSTLFNMYLQSGIALAILMLSLTGQARARVCNDKHIIDSTPLTMSSGHVVTMQHFNCSNTVVESASSKEMTLRGMSSLDLRAKRAATQCTQANCICGIPCFFNGCAPASQTIHASDCTALANSLMNNPDTFLLPPGQGVAFILESCEYGAFSPSVTETIQYCFSDMGVAALQVFDVCGSTQVGSCKGTFDGGNFFVDQIAL